MLQARTVSGAVVAIGASLVLILARRARETCGEEAAEDVSPHWSCGERDVAVGEGVAEGCDGAEGVIAKFVFADCYVEDLIRVCQFVNGVVYLFGWYGILGKVCYLSGESCNVVSEEESGLGRLLGKQSQELHSRSSGGIDIDGDIEDGARGRDRGSVVIEEELEEDW